MSEYWTFKCNTCEIECGESANHLDHVLLNILRNSDNFKKIRESDKDGYIEFGIMNHSPSLIEFVIEVIISLILYKYRKLLLVSCV